MTVRSLIIDCDPGVDDAVALMLAFGSPELDLAAITTVVGNVPLEQTTRNARLLRQIAGREDVPVFAGAERPLRREPAGAGAFHGEEGLGDLEPFEPDAACAPGHAADAIVAQVMARPPRSTAVAVLGPMTNLALALRCEPALATRLGPVAAMGGARSEGGNITASAEFNIWADPDAAAEVLASGCEVVLFGLDVTHQVRAGDAQIAQVAEAATPAAETAAQMMRFSQRVERELVGGEAPPVHDPCPIAWLLEPDLFELRDCRIQVETDSELTRGHTAVDFRSRSAGDRTHRWATGVDAEGVFRRIASAVRRLPAAG